MRIPHSQPYPDQVALPYVTIYGLKQRIPADFQNVLLNDVI